MADLLAGAGSDGDSTNAGTDGLGTDRHGNRNGPPATSGGARIGGLLRTTIPFVDLPPVPLGPGRVRDHDARAAALKDELARIASERQGQWTVFASLIGVSLLLAGGFFALGNDKSPDQDWLWSALALIPILLFGYVTTLFAQTVVQSYYSREIERQLTELIETENQYLPPSLFDNITTALTGNRRGRWEIRLIHGAEYLVLGAILGAGSVKAITGITQVWLQAATSIACIVLGFSIAHLGYDATTRGVELWSRVRAEAIDNLSERFPQNRTPRSERRLISYLLLPRPNDLIVKGVMLHFVAALVGGWLVRDRIDWVTTFRHAAVSFTSFELLMYQGRYIWNDLRGYKDDRRSPRRVERMRMPDIGKPGSIRHTAVGVTLAIRAIAAIGVAFILPWPWSWRLVAAIVFAAALAQAYEWLREHERVSPRFEMNRTLVAVYVTVGISYAVRAGFGAYLGSDGLISLSVVATLAIAFYFSGLATVLMTWVLESTIYLGVRPEPIAPATIRPDGQPGDTDIGHAEGHHTVQLANISRADVYSEAIGTKLHLLPLARQAGLLAKSAVQESDVAEEDQPYRNKAVLDRSASCMQAWNIMLVAACMAAAAAGWLGHADTQSFGMAPAFAAAILGACAAVACIARPKETATVAGAVFCGLAVWLWQSGGGPSNALFGPLPLTVVLMTYAFMRFQTYDGVIGFAENLARIPSEMADAISRVARELLR